MRLYGESGADYGFFQMNARDVEEGIRLGMPPDLARHLHGGGRGGTSSEDEQTKAVADFIARKWPDETKSLIENNDFETLRSAVQGKWYGVNTGFDKRGRPLGHPAWARTEFAATRDAARVGGAAVMGGEPTSGLDAAARVRTTIDANSAARVRQLVEGAGHLRIEMPAQGPTPGERLFARPPPTRTIQMQPATVGPTEPAASWGG